MGWGWEGVNSQTPSISWLGCWACAAKCWFTTVSPRLLLVLDTLGEGCWMQVSRPSLSDLWHFSGHQRICILKRVHQEIWLCFSTGHILRNADLAEVFLASTSSIICEGFSVSWARWSIELITQNAAKSCYAERSWLKLILCDRGVFTAKGLLWFHSYVDIKKVLYSF